MISNDNGGYIPPGYNRVANTYMREYPTEGSGTSDEFFDWVKEKKSTPFPGASKKFYFEDYNLKALIKVGPFFACSAYHIVVQRVEVKPMYRKKGMFTSWLNEVLLKTGRKLKIVVGFESVMVPHLMQCLRKNGFTEQDLAFLETRYVVRVHDVFNKCGCRE